MTSELEIKTSRLSEMLAAEGLDAVLLNAQHNFAWLTGESNGIDLSRENGVASLLVTREGRRYVLTNVIEIERILTEQISEKDFGPIDFAWQDEKAGGCLVIEKARSVLAAGMALGTDLPFEPGARVIENKIAACRYELTAEEIARYRELGKDAGLTMQNVVESLNQGETELEIAEKLRHKLARGGMTSVVTLVAADERISQYRHPVPTTKRWKKTLLLVTCAKRNGLVASLSRMISIGEPSDELKRRTEAAASVNASLMAATRPGVSGQELYQTAARAYESVGFADEINRHHQGGAAGYKTRDWVAHPHSSDVVQCNQAFAWNPSITGTKVEETGIANANGFEIITTSPDFPSMATTVNGREYLSPGILSL